MNLLQTFMNLLQTFMNLLNKGFNTKNGQSNGRENKGTAIIRAEFAADNNAKAEFPGKINGNRQCFGGIGKKSKRCL